MSDITRNRDKSLTTDYTDFTDELEPGSLGLGAHTNFPGTENRGKDFDSSSYNPWSSVKSVVSFPEFGNVKL